MIDPDIPCPCGSTKNFSHCCQPVIDGTFPASTAEALMRSRYCAFVTGNEKYLLHSWHHSSRPASVDTRNSPSWCKLSIIACRKGKENDRKGTVEFKATAIAGKNVIILHETSEFIKEKGKWYYLDGHQHSPALQKKENKTGRNSPCPCGSGKKYKKCCSGC